MKPCLPYLSLHNSFHAHLSVSLHSRRLYGEAVKLCIGGKWTNCSEASNMKRLVQQLGEDWGEEEGKALLYSSAFQTAR